MSFQIPHPLPLLRRRAPLILACAVGAVGLFAAVHAAQPPKNPVAIKRDETPLARGQFEPASFSSVVKRVSPSVVEVAMEIRSHDVAPGGRERDFPGMNDPFFRQFFGNRLPEIREAPQSGRGSGVIISADGFIATNNHVVDHADRLTVTLSDGREFTAHVVGRDPQTDIAVIKVEAKDLPSITFAASAKVEVGDRVLAIGNPFGIGESVTAGIVSAKGRRANLGIAYEDFIQTDAAINPGNSGGALVDLDGRLVGINTAILSRSGGFQGVGLAVPSDLVSYVVDSLVRHGKIVRGYLGVGVQDLTPALADSFGLSSHSGALVTDVQPNTAASKAGLKSGDVITGLDGKPVTDANQLSLAISETAPGTRLALDVLRNGRTEHVTATTSVKPRIEGDRQEGSSVSAGDDQDVLKGVAVDDLDEAARREMNFPARLQGAVITNVDPDSAAARAGIQAGDVILEINRHPVSSAKDAVDLSANATSRKTLVKLWSHGNTVYVIVDESSDSDKGSS